MKPPPRKRTKLDRNLNYESEKPVSKWHRPEQQKLLQGLKRLSMNGGENRELDYAFLEKYVASRSVSEILSLVESLKNKVISCARLELKKRRWEEKRLRKPIEMWTHMASTVAGIHEEQISTAFSQLLIVSSTEPRTLRNSDPPQVHRPPTDKLVGRTIPLRPMPHLPIRVSNRIASTQKQLSSNTSGTSPLAHSTSQSTSGKIPPSSVATNTQTVDALVIQQPSEQHPTTSSTTAALSSSSPLTVPSSSTITPVSCASRSSMGSITTTTLSTSTAAMHARFGRTSKYATKDSPRMLGVQCVVDFERIYHYLSAIHKPNDDCKLTAMESAIVLDLLMSLPEELPLLDCNKLHNHLIQVHQCFSSPADSRNWKQMFKNLMDRFVSNREAPDTQHGNIAADQGATAGAAVGNEGQKYSEGQKSNEAESQSSVCQSSEKQPPDVTDLCPPPLNPFMVPIQMLMRK